jgi:acyl-CoA synthetase (NDP forming)
LPDLVSVSNPLDYHTFSWANGTALTATFAAMLNCGFDLTALILDYPRGDRCDASDWVTASDALIAAHRATGRPAAIIATLPECLPEDRATALLEAGVVPLLGIDEALAAIEAAAELGVAPIGASPITGRAPAGEPIMLDEVCSKHALGVSGVSVPTGLRVRTPEEAVAAARRIGFPVVLKAVGDRLAHKTERDAVRLGLRDEDAVRAAATELAAIAEALLVEAMVTGAVAELIIGVNRDPAIGPYMVIGSGGVLVELVGDSAILLMPATANEIRTAVATLKVARLLAGWRGRPAGDMQDVVQTVLAIQSYAIANLDRLLELDVNPVMVLPDGAVAVDAMIRLAKETDDD